MSGSPKPYDGTHAGPPPAIIIFTTTAAALAAQLAGITGGRVHACGPAGEGARELLPRLFAEGVPIIGICASGILIRILAPHIGDKHKEPPVLAVSADGRHVVPLLGGHRGANRMAREVAGAVGATAAITTASDSHFLRGLDEPPEGYVLADPDAAKAAMAAVLNGERIALDGDAPWLIEAGYPIAANGTVAISVTDRTDANGLVFHPKTLVAGMGCERGADPEELIELLEATLAEAGLAQQSLAAIASIDLKADEHALNVVAAHFGVPLRLFSAAELAEEAERLPNPSELVKAEVGTPGVAEAAALKAGALLVEKRKSKRATCAIGRAATPIDPAILGRARGAVHLVGIGPGEAAQRTGSAIAALQSVTDWVGYDLYLDLAADLRADQIEHRFPLGGEEDRVRHALELAGTGRPVALLCSGDAQIYAMAALVFELLAAKGDRALSDAAQRVVVESHPGISAFQMASARAGALIGHDFCCISLSDLLTPREDILKRLEAAAAGNFVTAFYNPRSLRRTDLIETATAIFQKHRMKTCPVVIARSLCRSDESVKVTTLAEFDPAEVDMMTIVLFGSTQSQAFARGDGDIAAFTPRGYAKKAGGDI